MSMTENDLSVVKQIKGRYETRSSSTTPQKASLVSQDIDTKLGLSSPHFTEIRDLDKYEAEGAEWTPIQYFRHKEDENKRIVRVVSPFEDRPDILIELPEKPTDPYLQQLISTWKEIQHIVMLDQEMLELVYQMGVRYESRQPMIVEGPPARSKTFAAWVFSSILETPYARMTCSAGTRESYLLGSLQPTRERVGLYTIRDVLTNQAVMNRVNIYENALKESKDGKTKLSFKDEADISEFLTSVQTLLDLDNPVKQTQDTNTPAEKTKLDDRRVVMAYDIIANRTGIQLVGDTKYDYVDSDLVRVYEKGGIGICDEFNTIADDGVQNAVIPMFEPRTGSFRVSSQRNPTEATRNSNFWAVITMNPAVTAGRRLLADPTISRTLPVELGGVTEEYVENVLTYYLTGNDPDIRVKGKLVKGRKDVQTPYRALEKIPYRELVVKAITDVHTTISSWIDDEKKIGAARREGGFYVFDQRKVTAALDLMLQYYNKRFSESGGKLSQINEPEWAGMVKSALQEIYEAGIHGEIMDPESDRRKVHELIEGLPVWDKLKLNTGKGAQPLQEVATSKGKGVKPKW